jgi:DNA repair exonuclease SbcCD ATPase subunit
VKELLTESLDELLEFERHVAETNEFYVEKMTRRESIARRLERSAQHIRDMKYRTFDEFKAAKDVNMAICPGCGCKGRWDID